MKKLLISVIFIASLFSVEKASAWGIWAHRFITYKDFLIGYKKISEGQAMRAAYRLAYILNETLK